MQPIDTLPVRQVNEVAVNHIQGYRQRQPQYKPTNQVDNLTSRTQRSSTDIGLDVSGKPLTGSTNT